MILYESTYWNINEILTLRKAISHFGVEVNELSYTLEGGLDELLVHRLVPQLNWHLNGKSPHIIWLRAAEHHKQDMARSFHDYFIDAVTNWEIASFIEVHDTVETNLDVLQTKFITDVNYACAYPKNMTVAGPVIDPKIAVLPMFQDIFNKYYLNVPSSTKYVISMRDYMLVTMNSKHYE